MEIETVMVTGITGYLGSWVGKYLLEQCPQFNVRAAVRNPAKAQDLKVTYGDELSQRLEFVEADLQNPDSLRQAMNGANYIIHVANPLPSSQNKYKKKEMAKQAVSGMRTILDHCKANRVKKLIITSSIVSMVDYKKKGPKPTYDHTDFAEKSVDEYA